MKAKDRAERLRSSAPRAPSPNIVQVDAEADSMFQQMKRLLATQNTRKPAMTDGAVQTMESHPPEAKAQKIEVKKSTVDSIKFIHYLLCKDNSNTMNDRFFDAISTSYEYIIEECSKPEPNSSHNINVMLAIKEKYLDIVFKNVITLTPFERHSIATLVYKTLSDQRLSGELKNQTDRIVVLLYLIPLGCITQPEVIDALLDGLLIQLTSSSKSRSLLMEYGIGPLLGLLVQTPPRESTSNLVSCIFLMLLSEGLKVIVLRFKIPFSPNVSNL